jgi:hypothetical protein
VPGVAKPDLKSVRGLSKETTFPTVQNVGSSTLKQSPGSPLKRFANWIRHVDPRVKFTVLVCATVAISAAAFGGLAFGGVLLMAPGFAIALGIAFAGAIIFLSTRC